MSKKIKQPKYKVGDMVFSWQNKNVKKRIAFVYPSNDATYQHKYKVTLHDNEGYPYSSKYMGENSITKVRTKKWKLENLY